jgi:hypothetical protein
VSRNSIKAIDLYIAVSNYGDVSNLSSGEAKRRERKLKRFRNAMAKVTLEEFLNGRWAHTAMEKRMKQWNDMQALCASDPDQAPPS